jgi:hypothetical protein
LDNTAVFDSLKSYVLGGPHWTWIQDFEHQRDGRSAWLTLKEHFDGPGSKIRLKAAAYAAFKRAECKGAKNFDFELYRRIHNQAHSDLVRYGEPIPETKKVKDFLDRITDPTLQPVKYTIAGFTHLMQSFHDAANYIGNIIDLNKKSDYNAQNVSSTFTGRGGRGRGHGKGRNNGRGGHGRGKGCGRGGRNANGNANPGHWISSEEWNNMPDNKKETIRNARANYANNKQNIGAITTGDDDDQNATGGMNDGQGGSPPKRPNVDTSNAEDHMSRGNRNYISQIRSSKCYAIITDHQVSAMRHDNMNNKEAKAELDSHADTTVAGSTCRVIEYMNKSCDVFPFLENYDPMEKVPVARVATAYDHPSTGETFILVFGQSLYLGDKLEHALICPNQARLNGVVVDDIPKHLSHDGSSTHSIYFPDENGCLPLCLRGVISYLPTRYPSYGEINNCRWLVVTGDDE